MSQISTLKIVACACLLLAACFTAHADFDAKYKAYSGDLDNNGYNDLFLARSPDLVMIPLDDISIPITKRRAEYIVLMQGANKSFTVNSAPSAANVATMRMWTPSPVQLTARDLNVDGQQDIFIKNFTGDPKFLAGTADQIVYAATGTTAATSVAVTQTMRDFFTQIHGWILDRDYFILTALDNNWFHYDDPHRRAGGTSAISISSTRTAMALSAFLTLRTIGQIPTMYPRIAGTSLRFAGSHRASGRSLAPIRPTYRSSSSTSISTRTP